MKNRYCIGALGVGVLVAGCGGGGNSSSTSTPSPSVGNFTQANLVADQAGVAAWTDPKLVNPWGVSYSPTGAFWLSDNGSGYSTLYNGAGAPQSLVVTIPAAGGKSNGPVSGQVYNSTTDFQLNGSPASFIFDSEDGLITAWGGGATATTVVDESASGAVYKGLAMGINGGANYLYAANFNAGTVEVFDKTFTKTSSFTDPNLPAGYAPFGITNIGGSLYVTFALQNAAKHDDVAGAGWGYVDVFSTSGTLMTRLVSQGALNAPWGLVQAPAGFGTIGGDLLVGNFGDGKVNVYNISTGALIGHLSNSTGTPLVIPGLWALIFGNGGSGGATNTMYFTAGPDNENHGLFGSLAPK
jgi:uncharacterized protein (TIGR03118 family)